MTLVMKILGFTKLLVGNGYNNGELTNIEVIDLSSESKTCQDLPNFPFKARGQMGGLFNQTTPLICGGWDGASYRSDCYSLQDSIWTQVPTNQK